MGNFVFNLDQPVALVMSGEKGRVIGRAEYVDMINQYRVRYLAGDGRQVEDWFSEEAIIYDHSAAPTAA